jgi:hypothetical protein
VRWFAEASWSDQKVRETTPAHYQGIYDAH